MITKFRKNKKKEPIIGVCHAEVISQGGTRFLKKARESGGEEFVKRRGKENESLGGS